MLKLPFESIAMIERLELALETPIGLFLIVLVTLLTVLLLAYLFVMLLAKEKDRLKYLHHTYYEQAESLLKDYMFAGAPHIHFFGRESLVVDKEKREYICLIPPPEIATSATCNRFELFMESIEAHWPPLFAHYSWTHLQNELILVQDQRINSNAKPLISLNAFQKDKRFTNGDKEKTLIQIAQNLALLHGRHTEAGERLYYGLLQPSSFFIDIDASHRISRFILTYLGLPFALGSRLFYEQVIQGKMPLDKYRREEFLLQLPYMAPEQTDPALLDRVGPACDLYSFGALGVYLFTGGKIKKGVAVAWEQVPEQWRSFLKRCLEIDPERRPQSFGELDEWLNDPEISLTANDSSEYVPLSTEACVLGSIEEILSQLKAKESEGSVVDGVAPYKALSQGASAMKLARWQAAADHFSAVLRIEPEHSEALLKMGICKYELGDMVEAEKYVCQAQKKDTGAGKAFRDYIAFRI